MEEVKFLECPHWLMKLLFSFCRGGSKVCLMSPLVAEKVSFSFVREEVKFLESSH